MGWKNLKEHYRIEHSVCVTEKGICIGSPYIHDLIIISLDGKIIKADDGRVNEDLRRYMAEMKAELKKLRAVVKSTDTFTAAIPVYTFDGGTIVEKKCESPGWPNATHDGEMMYDNSFSTDRSIVVKWAKANAVSQVSYQERRVEELKSQIIVMESDIAQSKANLAKLDADYPEKKEAECSTQ